MCCMTFAEGIHRSKPDAFKSTCVSVCASSGNSCSLALFSIHWCVLGYNRNQSLPQSPKQSHKHPNPCQEAMARHNQTTAPLHICSSDDEMREAENNSLVESVTIVPGRIQMAIMTKKPRAEKNAASYYFTTDEQLVYANFYQDFGPLNLAKLYRFCTFLNNALQDEIHADKTFYYYTRNEPKKILNAAYLIGSYIIIYRQFNVPTVMKTLGPILKHANGAKFCDASINDLAFLSLKDCFGGIHKAVQKNFFDFDDFNVDDYEHYECVENGDFNWIVPDKLLAFCGPNSRTERTSDSVMLGPEVYIDYFHANNVTVVVRLNSPRYDAHAFTRAGIQHHDLYFSDGSSPSERLAKQFLKIVENARGAVAVHCKAGLGRTGTLIGAYLIKHYQFTAMEAIAWLRICRPGSVIGQQQTWLNSKQTQLLQEGEIYRQQRHHLYNPPEKHDHGVYSMVREEHTQKSTQPPGTQPTTDQELDSENVQRISQRVDTMRLNDEDDQEEEGDRVDSVSQTNNNIVHCKPIRTKKVAKLTTRHTRWTRSNNGRTVVSNATTTATAVRRGRGNVAPLGGTPQRASLQETLVSRKKLVSSRTELLTTPFSVRNLRNATIQTASQGDQLNSIKAARRQHVPTDAIQQKTNSTKMTVPPATVTSSQVESSARPVASTSFAVEVDEADSAEQTAAISTIARKDTLKKNHAGDASTSQPAILPSHQFVTMVSTQVNHGKEITYQVTLGCNQIVKYLLPGVLIPVMKKMKTSEVVLRFEPYYFCAIDLFSFGVTLDMADVFSVDHLAPDLQSPIGRNGSLRTTVPVQKETNKVSSGRHQSAAVKPMEKTIPAKLTWLLSERNRLTFRVCFDVTLLADTLADKTYIHGLIRAATTVPVSGSPPNRQFKTTVTGAREDSTDQRVHFVLTLNLTKILEKRRNMGTRKAGVDTCKSFPQPCSSKGVKPTLSRTKSNSTAAMEEEDSNGYTSLDHNGNNAAVSSARATTNNVTAETDTRPSKRFRYDVSRQW
ncbi:uncharacterized protein LOC118505667 isoform X2 [Anopheles stephensi]|uniref:uncharacterized protein LOC118505667 isoform X2 n=1 Tax=Anopheles stephensi TaxID=30069 RepID=UPI001658C1D4|nr:uncharacterized protein LOC118505667 isoform X2 [Anopheles stephensi]